jgi:sugar/nucleoside kinase (ribokinase family)
VPAVNFGPVRNTVGCGDAFTAAFVASRLRGEGYREAMTTAAQMAGKVAAGMLDAL